MSVISRCAFCGGQHPQGFNSFAHRYAPNRVETVKVCKHCEPEARREGYAVAEREPRAGGGTPEDLFVTPP